MGLTIHYSFRAPEANAGTAKNVIHQLWRSATTAGFAEVGQILHLREDACDFNLHDADDDLRWLLIQATRHVDYSPRNDPRKRTIAIDVCPSEVIAFTTLPGAGCEPANFGLARYPKSVRFYYGGKQRNISTRALGKGWHWHSFCKTQYASDPRYGGVENFLRCHLGVIKVLDTAKSLGILANVSDEGGYWKNRDAEALAREVGQWNEIIAAFVGALNDAIRAAEVGNVAAPILERPDFEHLEAAGHKLLKKDK